MISSKNTIVITQSRMAGWLMFNRFNKLDEKKDLKNPDRKVYIFKNSPQLSKALLLYNKYKNEIDEHYNTDNT